MGGGAAAARSSRASQDGLDSSARPVEQVVLGGAPPGRSPPGAVDGAAGPSSPLAGWMNSHVDVDESPASAGSTSGWSRSTMTRTRTPLPRTSTDIDSRTSGLPITMRPAEGGWRAEGQCGKMPRGCNWPRSSMSDARKAMHTHTSFEAENEASKRLSDAFRVADSTRSEEYPFDFSRGGKVRWKEVQHVRLSLTPAVFSARHVFFQTLSRQRWTYSHSPTRSAG